MESSFAEGLVEPSITTNERPSTTAPANQSDAQIPMEGEEGEEDHSSIKFTMPTAQQLAET